MGTRPKLPEEHLGNDLGKLAVRIRRNSADHDLARQLLAWQVWQPIPKSLHENVPGTLSLAHPVVLSSVCGTGTPLLILILREINLIGNLIDEPETLRAALIDFQQLDWYHQTRFGTDREESFSVRA